MSNFSIDKSSLNLTQNTLSANAENARSKQVPSQLNDNSSSKSGNNFRSIYSRNLQNSAAQTSQATPRFNPDLEHWYYNAPTITIIENTTIIFNGGLQIPQQVNSFALQAIAQILGLIVTLLEKLEMKGEDTPTQPTPENLPKSGDTYIRLGPIDQVSKSGELSGTNRGNPRTISNAVADQGDQQTSNSNNASDLLWSWGQFIDHDMILTKEGHDKANITVPRGDKKFDPAHTGKSFVPFTRSEATTDANGNREQINEQTALIDASMVYGATPEKTHELRSFSGGKLKLDDNGNLLPDAKEKVLSGDPRAAEQPGLLSLQTLFAREHNRQADIIAKANPNWTDEQIFNAARKTVANEIQAITYNEFLPILIGTERPISSRVTYNPAEVNGQVSSEFSTAAFRVGHTMVNDTIAYKDAQGNLQQAGLDEVFFKPEFTNSKGIGSVLSGMSEQKAQAVDPMLVNSLRNRLFGPPQAGGPAMDLGSLNIQRGRDHNLPSYNDMREALGYSRIESFNDPIFQDGVGAKLAKAYASPDDIDLWIGGLSEKALGSSMLGETFTTIVDEQFGRTAAADPHFYTRTSNTAEAEYLRNLTLSDVILANTKNAQIDDTAFIAD